ncbi:MAG: VWA domain-containing protein [Candidatus Omnitrophota bacterium]
MKKVIKFGIIFCLVVVVSPRLGEAEGEFLSQEDKNIGIEVTADKTTVSVNEKIKLNYNLYTRYDVRYEGFETEGRFRGFELDTPPLGSEIPREVAKVNGKKYVKACVKTMFLSPIYGGDLVVNPGTAKVGIAEESKMRAFFGLGPNQNKRRAALLDLKPIVIHVNNPTGKSKEEFLNEFSNRHGATTQLPPVKTDKTIVIILLDISGSMLAEDMQPKNRLTSAKAAIAKFLQANPDKMIGLKCFAKGVVTVSSVTQPNSEVVKALEGVHSGLIEKDGTSLGDAIFEATKELGGYAGNKKEIILLTDGMNNNSLLDPLTAIDFAFKDHIVVHTIALGTKGPVPYPDPKDGNKKIMMDAGIDEQVLAEIAKETGGKFGVAKSEVELEGLLNEIQKMLTK